ncbi:hypothetical protein C7974DRAFT_139432 [Boeremia exigua]|uniref:uncharacterized protein n=1 Tax=Boeremia exigua TaxID=749465 RepID=UPI001E8CB61B|nr:uncharacterized protein C7974DRAFT_139432 [Boeremia exigua]KAH6639825.1 hypothetical protein C7974DRAFT_139432 [Boeremia exigua]
MTTSSFAASLPSKIRGLSRLLLFLLTCAAGRGRGVAVAVWLALVLLFVSECFVAAVRASGDLVHADSRHEKQTEGLVRSARFRAPCRRSRVWRWSSSAAEVRVRWCSDQSQSSSHLSFLKSAARLFMFVVWVFGFSMVIVGTFRLW